MMAGLYYFVFTTLAMGFAVGIQIFIARRYGEGDYKRIGVVFQHGATFVLGLGILLFCILFFFSHRLLHVVHALACIHITCSESVYHVHILRHDLCGKWL